MYRADTIVACATAPGRAAVAIVRLSGADAFAIADAVFRPARSRAPRPWCLHRGHVVDANGAPVDDALAVRMPGPRSYTGEDVVELHCHGSPLVVERVIGACQSHGARTAERGEFSRRAVLNGRMDLAQAEAVADLIDARASAGVRAAWRQLQGALSTWLASLRSRLVGVLADVEANVDFSDEELPQENLPARIAVLEEVKAEIAATLAGFAAARREREGYVVAFCGRPNVGKSSLVNRLLGEERMIVSEEPGTTRDAVEETIDLDGMAFVLTDTAGVRTSPSRAESAAVTRALDRAAAADITVVVVDGSRVLEDEDRDLLARSHDGVTIAVVNKHDLPSRLDREELVASCRPGTLILRVSALTGEGCEHLACTFAEVAASDTAGERPPVAISRLRHRAALEAASRSLAEAVALVGGARDNELVAMELRAALGELASITDPVDNEAVLERIFREFCVGK